ncbi:MAG: GGDEF domain-containing protein [Pirellulales bacterium]
MLATRVSHGFCNPPVVAESSGMLVRIYPQEGIGEPIELTQQSLMVGREVAGLTLSDDSVSRRHAMIEWTGDVHLVSDLKSTNGTFVNERRIQKEVLRVGDRLRFGNQIFKYLTAGGIESQYHEVVFKIMTTDGLTQVYNKRYFLESFERELDYAQRSGVPLSVLLMDLDHFKSVNDTYGHLAGDTVLAEFAARAQCVLRSGEVLCRYGGEEFAMLCSRAELKEAAVAAERVRAITAASPVTFEDREIPITVSIGMACLDPATPKSINDLLAEADHWLYIAKASGRNQVRSAD